MDCQLGITTLSLGRCYAGHHLEHKLSLAQSHGYEGIELCYEDLLDVARQESGNTSQDAQLHAAKVIRRMTQTHEMSIINLQPIANYEGLLDREAHQEKLTQIKFWMQLAKVLCTDMVQIPSSYADASEISDDFEFIVQDLREAAELGLAEQPPIRFVYEALSFGTYCNTWEQSWKIVKAVDRSNFGICLDTFNIAGRIFADPEAMSGKVDDYDAAIRQSTRKLLHDIDLQKVFYVQVVDAERLAEPLQPDHVLYKEDEDPRMSWSRNCRLFYGEKERGGYLPILQLCRVIFHGLGFTGWVSLEVFHRDLEKSNLGIPAEFAARGAKSWRLLNKHLDSGTRESSTKTTV